VKVLSTVCKEDKKGIEENQCWGVQTVSNHLEGYWEEYEKSGTPSKFRGILPIHNEIPGVNGGDQAIYVKVGREVHTIHWVFDGVPQPLKSG